MVFVTNIFYILYVLMVALVFTWGTIWFVNIFLWLESVGDIAGSLFSAALSPWMSFVYTIISKAPLYFVPIFWAHYKVIVWEDERLNRYIIIFLYVLIVLFVYDVRLTELLPSPLYDAVKFLQTNCYCYLLGEVDYTKGLGGEIFKGGLDDMQYFIFDLTVIGVSGFMAWLFPDEE